MDLCEKSTKKDKRIAKAPLGDVNPAALLAFSGGASAFNVAGIPIDRDARVAEAGLDWQVNDDMTLGVSCAGQIGERAQVHEIKGSFNWRLETH
jgi:uncharacterized protein with beta-barrel porin domain